MTVTDEQIRALGDEADKAGNHERVNLCYRALNGDTAARNECAWILQHQEDQRRAMGYGCCDGNPGCPECNPEGYAKIMGEEPPVRVIKELTVNRVVLDLTEIEPSEIDDNPEIAMVRGLVEGMVPIRMTFDPPPDGTTMEQLELVCDPIVPEEVTRPMPTVPARFDVVNIDAHWFKARPQTWSVRLDWTHPVKGPLRTFIHTPYEALVQAAGCLPVTVVMAGISRGTDPGRSVTVPGPQ